MRRSIRRKRADTSGLETIRPAKSRGKLRRIPDRDRQKGGSDGSGPILIGSDRRRTRSLRFPLDSLVARDDGTAGSRRDGRRRRSADRRGDHLTGARRCRPGLDHADRRARLIALSAAGRSATTRRATSASPSAASPGLIGGSPFGADRGGVQRGVSKKRLEAYRATHAQASQKSLDTATASRISRRSFAPPFAAFQVALAGATDAPGAQGWASTW
jgi:hypothetical protein